VTGYRQSGAEGSGRGFVAAGEAYLAAVRAAGGLPVVLAPLATPEEIAATLDAVDGLLFTGGRDVDPRHFGEAVLNETVELEPDRDAFELPLIRGALARDLPVLAICRGCQVLNVALGGSLWQDLPAQRPGDLVHRQRAPRDAVTHAVHIRAGSLLAAVAGEGVADDTLQANTFHHQAVRDVAEGLVAVGYAADGMVEAVEAPDHAFVLGVQWHPESLAPRRPEHRRLFQALVEAAGGAAPAVPRRLRQTA
jgi:putative glutamine amidotransferase